MAALIEAIGIKRKMYFEMEDTPFHCLDAEISTPTARGGQTLVRLGSSGRSRSRTPRSGGPRTTRPGTRCAPS